MQHNGGRDDQTRSLQSKAGIGKCLNRHLSAEEETLREETWHSYMIYSWEIVRLKGDCIGLATPCRSCGVVGVEIVSSSTSDKGIN